jgi:hypothetical protein
MPNTERLVPLTRGQGAFHYLREQTQQTLEWLKYYEGGEV